MKHTQMTAEPRTVLGKKVARLRHEGKLPANIYGHGVASTAITLDEHDFGLLYRHLLPTTVIDLQVDGQTHPVLLAKATSHAATGAIIHVEFKQVNLLEKATATVSIVGTGESELVARNDAILLQSLDTVEVSALPDELPSTIEVDLSRLTDFEAAIHVKDLPVDRATVDVLTPGDDLVFKLALPQRVEEPVAAGEGIEEAVEEAAEGAEDGAASDEA